MPACLPACLVERLSASAAASCYLRALPSEVSRNRAKRAYLVSRVFYSTRRSSSSSCAFNFVYSDALSILNQLRPLRPKLQKRFRNPLGGGGDDDDEKLRTKDEGKQVAWRRRWVIHLDTAAAAAASLTKVFVCLRRARPPARSRKPERDLSVQRKRCERVLRSDGKRSQSSPERSSGFGGELATTKVTGNLSNGSRTPKEVLGDRVITTEETSS